MPSHRVSGLCTRKPDPGEVRREVLEMLETTNGNILRAAHLLGVGRRHLYKVIYREDLWDEVDRIRQQHRQHVDEPEWLKQTREALRS